MKNTQRKVQLEKEKLLKKLNQKERKFIKKTLKTNIKCQILVTERNVKKMCLFYRRRKAQRD